ncbi:MAG: SpoVR family protein [Bdellovibrio sp.]|nr:SpoVR family protein [Bdellovibrio sp.]
MTNFRTRSIDGELQILKEEIEGYALTSGLDFYPVLFEVCDYDTVNILAAQGGFPSRYPHWRFGMEYDQLSKGYAYGLQKIYEMVVNTNPCYAYLLNANHWVDQKIVMAHVFGHADFFKNNLWFHNTDRKMMDVMANHGTKIRRYMNRYGQDRVEAHIDRVLSLENLLSMDVLFETAELQRRRTDIEKLASEEKKQGQDDDRSQALKSFMRSKERYKGKLEGPAKDDERASDEARPMAAALKKLPTKDIMAFLMDYAPLQEWESDVVGILRDEAYYFLPQRMTKIMNEGWASYWHSTIMCTKALSPSEIIDFADHHAGVMAMSRQQLNPYKVGIELFRDIEYRWNTGKFGKDYLECNDMHEKTHWNKNLGQGREKIFQVRRTHNDITFIDEFFTPEFCERQQLFTYKYNPRTGRNEIETRDFQLIKSKLLTSLTNFGQPLIEITEANFENRGELLLRHVHQGVDLDMGFATETMRNIFQLWKRPINLLTKVDDSETLFSFDGKEMRTRAK